MKSPIARLFGAALVPPLAMLPAYTLSMSVNAKRELGTWMPAPSWLLLVRALVVVYVIFSIAHTVYGSLVTILARHVHVKHWAIWAGLYVGPLAVVFLIDAWSPLRQLDALVDIGLAGIVAVVTWPFVWPVVALSRG